MEIIPGITALSEFDSDEETTDVGYSSHSETEVTEGSVPLSACKCGHGTSVSGMARRCRFGSTPLETIPATPVGAAMRSPPGLSRAAMRQARDQCRSSAIPAVSPVKKSSDVSSNKSKSSDRQCRFGSSQLGTVPRTPVGAGCWKAALAKAIGSPPGLSRTSMRQERDACNAEALSTSWGSCQKSEGAPSLRLSTALTIGPCGSPETPPALRAAKRRAAREALLLRTKQEAALLQVGVRAAFSSDADEQLCSYSKFPKEANAALAHDFDDCDQTTDVGHGSSSEAESSSESSATEGRPCCFTGPSLRTIPIMSAASPPGLSRAAMRQARDACKAEGLQGTSWGSCHAHAVPPLPSTALLTIGPKGNALTPPSMRSAKRRAGQDDLLVCAR